MPCFICGAFPKIAINVKDTRIWRQLPNPVPSNRMCFHIKHDLECPHCKVGLAPEEEVKEMYFIEPNFKGIVKKKDGYTCQVCGYKQKEKPKPIPHQQKDETDRDYLYRRFIANLAKSDKEKRLVVAHFHKRYGKETYKKRHEIQNVRILCEDCHNAETANHQIERWVDRLKKCLWLKRLE